MTVTITITITITTSNSTSNSTSTSTTTAAATATTITTTTTTNTTNNHSNNNNNSNSCGKASMYFPSRTCTPGQVSKPLSFLYIYIYIYIYVCIYRERERDVYVSVHIYIYIYIHMYMYACICMHVYVCMYMYIYIYIYRSFSAVLLPGFTPWLRTNGINTNGVAAKITMFYRLGKNVRDNYIWTDVDRLVPNKSLCQKNMNLAVTPLVLTPFVPFRTPVSTSCTGRGALRLML